MSKNREIKIAVLKAKLSEYLSKVRAGAEVIVLDRNTPIAMIIPFPTDTSFSLETIPPEDSRPIAEAKGKKFGKSKVTSLQILEDDRESKK